MYFSCSLSLSNFLLYFFLSLTLPPTSHTLPETPSPTRYISLATSYTLHPPPYIKHNIPYNLHPTPYTLAFHPLQRLHGQPFTPHPHSTPYILDVTPLTWHPTACILSPWPHNLHPSPCIQNIVSKISFEPLELCLTHKIRLWLLFVIANHNNSNLRPAPDIKHPTPYIPQPTPYTLMHLLLI